VISIILDSMQRLERQPAPQSESCLPSPVRP